MSEMNEYNAAIQFAEEYFERCRQIQNLANSQDHIRPVASTREIIQKEETEESHVFVLDDDKTKKDETNETNGTNMNSITNFPRVLEIEDSMDAADLDITSVGVLKEWIDISELDITKHASLDRRKEGTDLDNVIITSGDKQDENVVSRSVNSEASDADWADLNVEEDLKEETHDVSKSSEAKYECEYCKYRTDWKSNMNKHVISRHKSLEEIEWVQCAHCDYKAKNKEYLIHHSRHKHTTVWYDCTQCPKKFKTKQLASVHKLLIHTADEDAEWFRCEHCHYKTKLKKNLKEHKYIIHSREDEIEWFKCDQCTYRGKTKKLLKRHQMQHSNWEDLKWLKCDFCEHKTTRKYNLRMHIEAFHANQVRYPVEIGDENEVQSEDGDLKVCDEMEFEKHEVIDDKSFLFS